MAVDSGEEFTVEVRGAFDDVERGTDTVHAGLRRASLGADRWPDCRARRQTR
jgi:hypothetical protein